MSEATFTFRVEEELKSAFSETAKARDQTGAQLLRGFMRDYVKNQQEHAQYDVWFRQQVQLGLISANSGNLIAAEEVEAEFLERRSETLRKTLKVDFVKLAWTPEALSDRRDIYAYIENDNPRAAFMLDEQFTNRAAQLASYPMIGRIGRVAGTRELVAHPNYILIYDVVGEAIRILRILHAARQWSAEEK